MIKIGDRVKVISVSNLFKSENDRIIIGMTGTVKDITEFIVGVEFDDYMGGHNGNWKGKDGYCWWVEYKHLEKIEETKEK